MQKLGYSFMVYDGILCNWSSGRIKRDYKLDPKKLAFFNKRGIGLALTFANPVIDINDPVGRNALDMLEEYSLKFNVKNGVILINEDLREVIVDKYPNLIKIYSITGHPNNIIVDEDQLNYYLDLEAKYDIIVPKFEMTFNQTFLEAIDVQKYEPIIDDTCVHGCPIFREHLFEMARINRTYANPWKELGEEKCRLLEECWIPSFDPDVGSEKDRIKYGCHGLGMDIYLEEDLKKFFDVGYRHIKLTGRELPSKTFIENMKRNLTNIKNAYESKAKFGKIKNESS